MLTHFHTLCSCYSVAAGVKCHDCFSWTCPYIDTLCCHTFTHCVHVAAIETHFYTLCSCRSVTAGVKCHDCSSWNCRYIDIRSHTVFICSVAAGVKCHDCSSWNYRYIDTRSHTVFICSVAAGVKCHDCSSWNPYCKEKVDEPFESAVAAVECEKTSTCFLKKDESGGEFAARGCAPAF